MNNSKVAAQIIVGTVSIISGISLARAGTKTLIKAAISLSDEISRRIAKPIK